MTPRWQLARSKAVDLLRRCDVQHPPVPVEDLARECGAVIRREMLDSDMSGMVYRLNPSRAVIGVNTKHSTTRQRFTIAHELGHLLLHDSEQLHFDDKFVIGFRNTESSLAMDPKEVEANQFAAELLMPISLLRRDLQALGSFDADSDEVIVNLASTYEVSTAAMAIRISRFLTLHR